MVQLSDEQRGEIVRCVNGGGFALLTSAKLYEYFPQLPARPTDVTPEYVADLILKTSVIPALPLGGYPQFVVCAYEKNEIRVFVGIGTVSVEIGSDGTRTMKVEVVPGAGSQERQVWLTEHVLRITTRQEILLLDIAAAEPIAKLPEEMN